MASLNPFQGVLGRRKAAHLLRRASFRFTRTKVDEMAGQTAAAALATLLSPNPLLLDQPVYANGPAAPVTWINPPQPPSAPLPADDKVLKPYVLAWWLNEALHDAGISHRMSMFFHQFLAADAASGSSMQYFDYLSLLRWGSLGNFKKLVTKMVTKRNAPLSAFVESIDIVNFSIYARRESNPQPQASEACTLSS